MPRKRKRQNPVQGNAADPLAAQQTPPQPATRSRAERALHRLRRRLPILAFLFLGMTIVDGARSRRRPRMAAVR